MWGMSVSLWSLCSLLQCFYFPFGVLVFPLQKQPSNSFLPDDVGSLDLGIAHSFCKETDHVSVLRSSFLLHHAIANLWTESELYLIIWAMAVGLETQPRDLHGEPMWFNEGTHPVDLHDPLGRTPLLVAMRRARRVTVSVLLRAFADVELNGKLSHYIDFPLLAALRNVRPDALKLMLRFNADPNRLLKFVSFHKYLGGTFEEGRYYLPGLNMEDLGRQGVVGDRLVTLATHQEYLTWMAKNTLAQVVTFIENAFMPESVSALVETLTPGISMPSEKKTVQVETIYVDVVDQKTGAGGICGKTQTPMLEVVDPPASSAHMYKRNEEEEVADSMDAAAGGIKEQEETADGEDTNIFTARLDESRTYEKLRRESVRQEGGDNAQWFRKSTGAIMLHVNQECAFREVQLTIRKCVFESNKSVRGGSAVSFVVDRATRLEHRQVPTAKQRLRLEIEDSQFANNTSTGEGLEGGAVFFTVERRQSLPIESFLLERRDGANSLGSRMTSNVGSSDASSTHCDLCKLILHLMETNKGGSGQPRQETDTSVEPINGTNGEMSLPNGESQHANAAGAEGSQVYSSSPGPTVIQDSEVSSALMKVTFPQWMDTEMISRSLQKSSPLFVEKSSCLHLQDSDVECRAGQTVRSVERQERSGHFLMPFPVLPTHSQWSVMTEKHWADGQTIMRAFSFECQKCPKGGADILKLANRFCSMVKVRLPKKSPEIRKPLSFAMKAIRNLRSPLKAFVHWLTTTAYDVVVPSRKSVDLEDEVDLSLPSDVPQSIEEGDFPVSLLHCTPCARSFCDPHTTPIRMKQLDYAAVFRGRDGIEEMQNGNVKPRPDEKTPAFLQMPSTTGADKEKHEAKNLPGNSCSGHRTGLLCTECPKGMHPLIQSPECAHNSSCNPGLAWAFFLIYGFGIGIFSISCQAQSTAFFKLITNYFQTLSLMDLDIVETVMKHISNIFDPLTSDDQETESGKEDKTGAGGDGEGDAGHIQFHSAKTAEEDSGLETHLTGGVAEGGESDEEGALANLKATTEEVVENTSGLCFLESQSSTNKIVLDEWMGMSAFACLAVIWLVSWAIMSVPKKESSVRGDTTTPPSGSGEKRDDQSSEGRDAEETGTGPTPLIARADTQEAEEARFLGISLGGSRAGAGAPTETGHSGVVPGTQQTGERPKAITWHVRPEVPEWEQLHLWHLPWWTTYVRVAVVYTLVLYQTVSKMLFGLLNCTTVIAPDEVAVVVPTASTRSLCFCILSAVMLAMNSTYEPFRFVFEQNTIILTDFATTVVAGTLFARHSTFEETGIGRLSFEDVEQDRLFRLVNFVVIFVPLAFAFSYMNVENDEIPLYIAVAMGVDGALSWWVYFKYEVPYLNPPFRRNPGAPSILKALKDEVLDEMPVIGPQDVKHFSIFRETDLTKYYASEVLSRSLYSGTPSSPTMIPYTPIRSPDTPALGHLPSSRENNQPSPLELSSAEGAQKEKTEPPFDPVPPPGPPPLNAFRVSRGNRAGQLSPASRESRPSEERGAPFPVPPEGSGTSPAAEGVSSGAFGRVLFSGNAEQRRPGNEAASSGIGGTYPEL
uniref:Uncharacterized protein n=1 Tax=Chromera velia CCMP2878 TaxID=1169474 RepID=A0A0G4HT50_9ALVE|eukprot:Cvel_8384.t1-p1 / transcript=Cvel_8384.t1 / gene=Cvel_8384 / organism=Chromera_velia_CCMP2878 / gene_product=hypothetical protein / transcript_product=hypothetical protein / location=Cvel_scaffold462:24686-44441(-) / protein_length=1565 / sequence_SO=supercontig / SO=protein_coding / is_pseudo=false